MEPAAQFTDSKFAKDQKNSPPISASTSPLKIILVSLALLVIWVLSYPAVGFLAGWQFGEKNLAKANSKLETGDFAGARAAADQAATNFKDSQEAAANVSLIANLFKKGDAVLQAQNYLFMEENIAIAVRLVVEADGLLEETAKSKAESATVLENLRKAEKDLEESSNRINIALSLSTEGSQLPQFLKSNYEKNLEVANRVKNLNFHLEESLDRLR